MKLISLTLHNYRKFQHAEINFPDGITAIIGNNGSGKSTIIEAIGWAIYGNKVARTNKEGIKRQNAAPNEECYVRLEFELGGDLYEVTRIMSPSLAVDANVKANGVVLASSATGVSRLLEKKIGMDYDAFFTSLVARQKEINALSSRTPGERKKSMLRMLKIDAIEDAVRKVRDDRKGKESVVKVMESTLKDVDEMKKDMEEKRAKKDAMISMMQQLEEKISALEKEAAELEESRQKEREKLERYNELEKEASVVGEKAESKRRQIAEKEKEKEALQKKKERYEQIKGVEAEYEKIKKEKERMEGLREKYLLVKQLKESITALEKEAGALEETIKELEKKIGDRDKVEKEAKEIEAEEKKIEERKREMESSIKIKKVQIDASMAKLKEAERERKKIEERGADSTCPTCGRPLKERYELILKDFAEKVGNEQEKIEKLEEEQKMLLNEIGRLEAEERELRKKRAEIEAVMEEMRKVEQEMNHAVESKKEKERKISDSKKKIAEMGEVEFDEMAYDSYRKKIEELLPLKEEVAVLRNEVARLPDLERQIAELKKDVEMLEGMAEKLRAEILDLNFDKKRYEEIERQYEEKKGEVQHVREQKIRMQGEIKQIGAELERMHEEIKQQKEAREKIRELRKEIAKLEMLAGDRDTGLLNDFKRYLISKIGPTLSYHASSFFNVFTAGKYSQMEIDDNYDIYIYDNGEKFSIERFSGGEEDLANLSLRLAISQVIAQRSGNLEFNFIVLDEIFGSQDNERRTNVLNTLGELSHQFQQVILITHIEEIKDSMQYVIRTFEDEEGISHVKME